ATREQWRFGGGTALAVVLGHRVSYDIDVFLTDPQLLPRLSPRLNDAATGLAKDYAESGDSLKMVLDDGDIDFIVRPCLLDAKPWSDQVVEGLALRMETPGEILAKKLLYRGERLAHRDAFDLVAAADLAGAEMDRARAAIGVRCARSVAAHLVRVAPAFAREMADYVNPTELGRRFLEGIEGRLVEVARRLEG
ncbi:MAG: nucleotidyl transferase AbiEii/AbiGii toxin family protein, partial [Alphaproteobacteria bacterium]|nr:nucleotidyl transferase AbiEii/AbiGii toxin family protein [Alphaproteobacteria bacterium]